MVPSSFICCILRYVSVHEAGFRCTFHSSFVIACAFTPRLFSSMTMFSIAEFQKPICVVGSARNGFSIEST